MKSENKILEIFPDENSFFLKFELNEISTHSFATLTTNPKENRRVNSYVTEIQSSLKINTFSEGCFMYF